MSVTERDRRYRQAGWAYLVLGFVVIGLTVWTPELARPERRADWMHLLAAIPFVVIFALVLSFGHELSRRFQGFVALLLTVSATGRTLVLAGNALGRRLRLDGDSPFFRLETVEPAPRMGLAAILMAGIVAMLVRAWWPRPG